MYELKSQYGPVIWLKIGTRNALVVQSARAATELFKKHDIHFASRTVPDSMTACAYAEGAIALAPYGEYWRAMRKICMVEIMVQNRVDASASLRQTCVESMICWIGENVGREVHLEEYLFRMILNLISSFIISRDVIDMRSLTANEFFEAISGFMGWIGKPNLTDAFGFLRCIDPQGIRRNSAKHLERVLNVVNKFVKERIQDRQNGSWTQSVDFLDALLDFKGKQPENLSDRNLSLVILEMFLAGTETTSGTIQWTMAELLKNPDVLKTLKAELDQTIGNSVPVQEKDMSKLPYLQAVLKESLRLHPSVPLLLPRKAIEETDFFGYLIPKNTTVIVNAWGIHRDPESWEDPLLFRPDRFLKSSVDYKGQHFELIPFGSGRRSCLGMVLGDRMVSLTVARLVQAFNWELPNGLEKLDMSESVGFSLRKLMPLKAIPRMWMIKA